jgi:DNA polymerase III delta subunit
MSRKWNNKIINSDILKYLLNYLKFNMRNCKSYIRKSSFYDSNIKDKYDIIELFINNIKDKYNKLHY